MLPYIINKLPREEKSIVFPRLTLLCDASENLWYITNIVGAVLLQISDPESKDLSLILIL